MFVHHIIHFKLISTNTPTDEVEVGLDHLGLLVGPRAAAHLLAVALAHLF